MKWPFATYLFQFGGPFWMRLALSNHQAADPAGLMQNLLYSSVFGSRPGDWVATTARTFSWRVVWTQTANHTPHTSKMNPFPQEFLTVFSFILCLSPLLFLHVAIQVCPFCESAPAFSLTDTGDSNITLKLKVAGSANRGVVFFSCPVGILEG